LSASRPFWLAAVALILISLIPFLLVDVPAVLDYPNHLARIFILAHPGDSELSRFYAPHWRVLPNLGFDLLGVALLKILPVHVGGRILLAISQIAPLLGVFVYARAVFGKLTLWPLAACLTAFNGIFFLGFMNFLLAIGLAFAAAGIWFALRRDGRDGWCLLFGSASSALLFLCHLFGVLLFALLIGCQEIAYSQKTSSKFSETRLRGLVFAAIALMPAVLLYFVSPLSEHAAGVDGWDGKHKLLGLFTSFMVPSTGLTVATGFAVFGVLILRARQSIFAPGTKLALIILALLYVAAPITIKGGTLVDFRLSLMMGLLLFAGIDLHLTPSWKKWSLVALVLLVGLRSFAIGQAWYDHRRDLADLRATLAYVPPGALVLAARGKNPETDPMTPARNLPHVLRLDSHLPALLVIERKAFWSHMFANPSQQPLVVRAPYDQIAEPSGYAPLWEWLLPSPAPGGEATKLPHLSRWPEQFDYVLLIDRPPALRVPGNFIPIHVGNYAALWRLAH
jgi:hypothetical protein